MNTAARILLHQFRISAGAARINLRGLDDEDAMGGAAAGSSPNWVLGHIVHMRQHVHAFLGLDPLEGAERVAPYGRGSSRPGPGEAVPLAELERMLASSQRAVGAALEALSPTALDEPVPKPDAYVGETVGTALAFFAFHESYHVGQLGVLRRVLGKSGMIQ